MALVSLVLLGALDDEVCQLALELGTPLDALLRDRRIALP